MFGLSALLEADIFDTVDEKVLEEFILSSSIYFTKEIINSLRACIKQEVLEVLKCLLLSLQELLMTRANTVRIHLLKEGLLFDYTLHIINEYYSLYKLWISDNNLEEVLKEFMKSIFNICNLIQKIVITFIEKNLEVFTPQTIYEYTAIAKVFHKLCGIGEYIILLDVKSVAEIWKCVSKLCTNSAYFIKSIDDADLLNSPIKFLCEEIKNSVSIIYKECMQESTDKIERILKINAFYLKILIKFATDVGYKLFSGCEHVIETYLYLSIPPHLVGTQISELVKRYLIIGMMNFITLIYKNIEFAKAFLNCNPINTQQYESFYNLAIEFFKISIMENDIVFMESYFIIDNEKYNLLTKIFENIIKSTDTLTKQEIYEDLVTVIAAFIISNCSSEQTLSMCERSLVNGVLQSNIMLAHICLDIWCLLGRFSRPEVRFQYFKFWADCYKMFPMFPNLPCQIYVKILLKNLYNFLPANNKNSLQEQSTGAVNFYDAALEEKSNDIGGSASDLIGDWCAFKENPRKDLYYKIVLRLKHVEATDNNRYKTELLIKDIFLQLLKPINDFNKHTMFWKSLIQFVLKNQNWLSHEFFDFIISKMEEIIGQSEDIFCNIIASDILLLCFTKSSIGSKNNIIATTKLLQNEIFIKKYFAFFCKDEIKTKIFSNKNYKPNLSTKQDLQTNVSLCKINFSHECKVNNKIVPAPINIGSNSNPTKKLKLDLNKANVSQMLKDASKARDVFRIAKPTSDEIQKLNQIINVLNEILINNKST